MEINVPMPTSGWLSCALPTTSLDVVKVSARQIFTGHSPCSRGLEKPQVTDD